MDSVSFLSRSRRGGLFGIPLPALACGDFVGADVLGKTVDRVWLQLAETRSFAERVRVAEAYLMPLAREARHRTGMMRAADAVLRHRGVVRVERLAGQAGLSVRQFERRFLDGVGLSPKLFARAARFQVALDASSRFAGSRTGLEIAHACGYFDQAHMIRDFHAFGGSAPSEIEGKIGDMRLWALEPSQEPRYW